ncbi:glucuronyl esterase domain-containing protein [Hymenobacter cheonanensis]|uniref:glucuronyl esterase domain-containing protein n=1 Tax=Hymenobacter sp. CA2-7 TaxID=3063993 RepID=UPI0027136B7A|nr:acetylxylan esterase [Hymenobacter sp. CA2-7]MDO7888032.1 acetylxylan esterase [Hymenobacter sp. CA2-7]
MKKLACLVLGAVLLRHVAVAQAPAPDFAKMSAEERTAYFAKQNAAAYADWQQTMQRLHLTVPQLGPEATDPNRPANTFRKGASGPWLDSVGTNYFRSAWGNWTNYREELAGGLPPAPALLTLANGQPVRTAADWTRQRRPELLRLYEQTIYGQQPAHTPAVRFDVTATEAGALGGQARRREVVGHIDNSRYPAATPRLAFTIYTPARATRPVPLMVIVWGGIFPTPTATIEKVLAKGWGVVLFDTGAVQQDSGAGLGQGIIGLMSQGQPRQPADWGVLSAWSWGLSRALDFLVKDPAIDAQHIGIEGHSRWGKTALLAGALDPRWAIVWASSAGSMGTSLEKRNFAESIDIVAGSGEYHWMAPNFLRYGGHWQDMPVDAHALLALIAPRPLFVTGGTKGDTWVDPHGEFLACVAASPVYELLGKKGLGSTTMPAPDHELVNGEIAFRLHEGGHTDALDWPTFLEFAGKYFPAAPAN